jgi:pyruvate formate lyase activating enzyme
MEDKGLIFDIQRFSIHDGPGIRTAVFLKGCPLRCSWCCNPESQSRQPELMWNRRDERSIVVGDWMTVEDVMGVVLRDKDYYEHSEGGMTLTGGEFMLQPGFAIALIDTAHLNGVTVVGETTGLAQPSTFAKLVDRLDLVMMDIKHYDPTRHFELTGARLPLILQNAAYLANSRTPHIFRIPVIPKTNESASDAQGFGRLLAQYGISEVELVPFHQYGKGKYGDLGRGYEFGQARSLSGADVEKFQARLEHEGITTSVSG